MKAASTEQSNSTFMPRSNSSRWSNLPTTVSSERPAPISFTATRMMSEANRPMPSIVQVAIGTLPRSPPPQGRASTASASTIGYSQTLSKITGATKAL